MNDGNRLGTGFFEKSLISDGCVVAKKHYLVFFRHEYYGGPHLPILRQRAEGIGRMRMIATCPLKKCPRAPSRIVFRPQLRKQNHIAGYSDYR